MDGIGLLVVAIILLGAGVIAAKTLGRKGATGQDEGEKLAGFPYQKQEQLLTPAERSFYGVLTSVANVSGWDVFAKVRLEDVIQVRKGTDKYHSHRNRIKSRHIDFLVCDRETVSPLVAIELNDSSHEGNGRQERDAFVAGALQAAGLPLMAVSVRQGYSMPELASLIQAKLGGDAAPEMPVVEPAMVEETTAETVVTVSCPKCGSALVERYSRKNGERFLGCSQYPACHHTQPI